MEHHLAQANIARFKAHLDHPSMKEFVDFLEPVNRFAEASPGFIWRLTDADGRSASYIETPFKEEMMAVNLSLWSNMEDFKHFVYGTVHSYFLRNKKKWFVMDGTSQFIMWWLPAGELPSLQMAKEKLALHDVQGDSPDVFSIKNSFDALGNPIKTEI